METDWRAAELYGGRPGDSAQVRGAAAVEPRRLSATVHPLSQPCSRTLMRDVGPSITFRLRQKVDSMRELWIMSLRIADVKRHRDVGCHSATFKPLAVHRNVGNRQ